MTRYSGSKALDANIKVDFDKNEVAMDYSLNKYGSIWSSNQCQLPLKGWRDATVLSRLKYIFVNDFLLSLAYMIAGVVYYFPSTLLNSYGIVKNQKYQYYHQSSLKWFYTHIGGMYTQKHEGELTTDHIEFQISLNCWVGYNLNGDYKNMVKSIELRRRMVDYKRYGAFPTKVQRGWEVAFTFNGIPKIGSCEIEYVGL
jgi:hypothetical protein